MNLQAVVFDLDGVITDTAELHYRAWQLLAGEEGVPFNRGINENLRGVPRRDSLLIILNGREETEGRIQEMMASKNDYYVSMLDMITPAHLLPGALELLDELDKAHIPYAIASASKNASTVCERLGISDRLVVLVDGHSVKRQKPHPDLFRRAAAELNCPPDLCLVVEDAAAGIAAAVAAGMPALALGPAERFEGLLGLNGRVALRDDLRNLTLAEIQQMITEDETWVVVQDEFGPATQGHMETVFTIGNGYFASRGSLEERYPGDHPLTLAHGIFDDTPIFFTELVNVPSWMDFELMVDEQPFRLDMGEVLHFRRHMNLRQGILRREVRWRSPDGVIVDLSFERFASYAQEHVACLRLLITAVNRQCSIALHTGIDGHVSNDNLLHWQFQGQGEDEERAVWLHCRTRHTCIELSAAAKVEATGETTVLAQQCPGQPRFSCSCQLEAAKTLQVDKLVSYAASRDPVLDEGLHVKDVVAHALQLVHAHSYDELRLAQQESWANLWDDCDVIIEGDDEAQLAVRFNLFQLLIAAA
jgi:kojibiose phosphorylase